MLILVKLIGIVIVAMGIIFLLNPEAMKRVINYWGQGKRLYLVGILRLLIGVVLLLSASQCRLVGAIVTLGILVLLGGIIIFALGLEKVKSILDWWDKKPLSVLRLLALIALAIGALLLYSV
ncbi:MAG: hypothetical protein AMJ78_09145 [Omnitrophica WOR_2 bacterium SM23_29]|nr:MAG: hypothetical protein AMJ78_09145 [Omnitrophica WOR_2 bacterium SM23_29]